MIDPGNLPELPMQVTDNRGARYWLRAQDMLGEPGGFGAVFGADGYAVKVFRKGHHQAPASLEQLLRLPIGDLRVARPLSILEGEWPGYVMELVPGMRTWRELVDSAPPWSCERDQSHQWQESGGWARRLELTRNLAETLTRLATRGLVFADLNPNNAMYQTDLHKAAEAWLIDVDNLKFGAGPGLRFPGYAAPEVLQGAPTTLQSDGWSLATLAFVTLTFAHPFMSGQKADMKDPVAAQLAPCSLPWIDDPFDSSNSTLVGLPRDTILPRGLREFFQQMFGAGRLKPEARPSSSQLVTALEDATHLTVSCPSCKQTLIPRRECPWCKEPVDALILQISWLPLTTTEIDRYRQDLPAHDHSIASSLKRGRIALTRGMQHELLPHLMSYGTWTRPFLIVERKAKGRLVFHKVGDSPPIAYRKRGGKWQVLNSSIDMAEDDPSWSLRIGPESGPFTRIGPTQ